MTNHATGDTVADVVNRPPLGVVLVAVAVIALGEASGAVIGAVRPAVARWAAARIAERPQAHGLTGSAEYDDEVRDRAVFATEAGLSFLHTHAEGLGLVAFFATTLVASVVGRRRVRAVLYALLVAGALFPVGYLVYALAVLQWGRETGIELAETWVLTPLGTAAIVGLLGLACLMWGAPTWPPTPPNRSEATRRSRGAPRSPDA